MQGKVEICGVNTAKLKVLDHERTRQLLRQAKGGVLAAWEELIAVGAQPQPSTVDM